MDELMGKRPTPTFEREPANNPLSHMSVAELLDLKQKIDGYLPAGGLKDINLERELLQQFAVLKELQASVIQDGETPANQKAQVAGQLAAILRQIVDLQIKLSREEEFKMMETCLVEAVSLLPEDGRKVFFEEYAVLARRSGLQ